MSQREDAELLLRYLMDMMDNIAFDEDGWTPCTITSVAKTIDLEPNAIIEFDMDAWVDTDLGDDDCGTSACILGHGSLDVRASTILEKYEISRYDHVDPNLPALNDLLSALGPKVDGAKAMDILFLPDYIPVRTQSAENIAEYFRHVVEKILNTPTSDRALLIQGMHHVAKGICFD